MIDLTDLGYLIFLVYCVVVAIAMFAVDIRNARKRKEILE